MSVIIRLQNLPWSANALDIRNFFRGLSIPEGGVHIVGGELGDAFIAFSTDEDARQGMMLDGGKIKEIQVRLLLSSRSEMHKVIETARQSVPLLLTAPAPAPAPVVQPIIPPLPPAAPTITPFSTALGNGLSFGIPGIGNPQEIPQPAVIEPPLPTISPPIITTEDTEEAERKRTKEKDRRRTRSSSRSRSRERESRKDRKRDRRDRSRSRERRRRDRSRSRDRRDRKRDRKDRSRSRERSPARRVRDKRGLRSPQIEKFDPQEVPDAPPISPFNNPMNQNVAPMQIMLPNPLMGSNGPTPQMEAKRFNNDPAVTDTLNKLQELGKKRNPNAFQGEPQQQISGGRFPMGRNDSRHQNVSRVGAVNNFRRDRNSRFDNEPQHDCCVAVRNAPSHTSYGDVRRFFPFMIDKHGIKMINDSMGRRSGNIFVRFCDPRSKHLALQRKNNELKGAEVLVEALDDDIYEAAVDSYLPFREDNDGEQSMIVPEPDIEKDAIDPFPEYNVLKLTDLPHFVKEHDIIKTFSDFSLLSIMLNDCRMTRSKTAFVHFVKSEDARVVYERKEKYMFGRRHPTITPISNEDYEKEKAAQAENAMEARQIPEPVVVEEPPIPEPVAPRDPRQRRFDNGSGPQIPQNQQQQPPAFFANPFAPSQQFAPSFPGPVNQFGGFPGGNVDPRAAAVGWANRPSFANQMVPNQIQNQPLNIEDEPLDCVLMKGLPRDATDRTIVTFLSDTGAVPARIHLMLDANGMPSGDCFCEFRSTQEARMAATKHGHSLDGFRVTVDPVSHSVVEEALEGPKPPELQAGLLGNMPPNGPPQFFDNTRGGFAPRGGFRGRGGFERGFERTGFRPSFDSGRGSIGGFRGRGFGIDRGGMDRGGRGFDRGRGRSFVRGRGGFENGGGQIREQEDQDPALEDFGTPGCVVSMENVPFRATVDEILDFFAEFDLSQDDIIRRYNEKGQPTGDARVAFRSPFDAQRAIKTRHMDTIHDRRINLKML